MAWLIMNASGILIAYLWSIVTGEWRGVPQKSRRQMFLRLADLFLSIVLVNIGDYILP